jgi:Tfp pilus assembly protein PilF
LATGQYYEAFAIVDEVLRSAGGRARRRARVLRAQARLKSGEGRRAAETELKAAIDEDAGNADAHFLLGTIYKAGGAQSLAAAAFRRTLALKPRHAGARAELEAEPTEESKERSGLRRFFGGS